MWKLNKEWYGRRPAAKAWVEWFAAEIEKRGPKKCKVAPWFFRDPVTDIAMEAHMDDIYGCGPDALVKPFIEDMKRTIKLKAATFQKRGPPSNTLSARGSTRRAATW